MTTTLLVEGESLPTHPTIVTTIEFPVLEEVAPIVNNQSHVLKESEEYEEDVEEIQTEDEVP